MQATYECNECKNIWIDYTSNEEEMKCPECGSKNYKCIDIAY